MITTTVSLLITVVSIDVVVVVGTCSETEPCVFKSWLINMKKCSIIHLIVNAIYEMIYFVISVAISLALKHTHTHT